MEEKQSNTPLMTILVVVAIPSIVAIYAFAAIGYSSQPHLPNNGRPPALAFSTNTPSAGVWRAQVMVDRVVALSAFEISLVNETSGAMIITETVLTATFSQTAAGVTLAFQDIASPGSFQLNSGDAFRLSRLVSPNRYTLNIVWAASGAIIGSVALPPT